MARVQKIISWPLEDSPGQRWVLIFILSGVLAFLLFPSVLKTTPDYRIGDVAARDIKASRTYLVEDAVSTEERRREAEAKVLTVYDLDPGLAKTIVGRVGQAFDLARAKAHPWEEEPSGSTAEPEPIDPQGAKAEEAALKAEFEAVLGVELTAKKWAELKRAKFSLEIENALVSLVNGVLGSKMVPNRETLLE
ncbi:MAG: hypothetical protein JRJ59_07940, partial [Deltaproteobacteria bacterium]|nr:hypothetical protein [Deltaproteobacteria bacterium]